MVGAAISPNQPSESLGSRVRRAILWRTGSQILAQIVQWTATFVVIRILDPRDYGLFAMTGVVLVFLNMLNGYGLASALIRRDSVTPLEIRQLFGMLIALNLALALAQIALAPLAAAYYRQEIVAPLLRVQALLYLTTPFIALPSALLSRTMDFRGQARADIAAATAAATAALTGAMLGWGIWTLVAAPMVLFTVRAAMLTWSARSLIWPSFDFRGAGHLARYGGMMAAAQMAWFLQSQADVFIAGRHFPPHLLGIYTTSLFLTQIVVAKFVPALNEVAFSAYARIRQDDAAVAQAFVRSVRIIFVAAMPCYLGLAATAEPLVLTVLGEKWRDAAPVVHLLALAMPFMTLQVLYAPACDARGRPGIGVGNGAAGALVLALAFLAGVRWGVTGLAWAWIAAYPVYLAISTWRSLPVIGCSVRDLAEAIAPSASAAIAMALVVRLADGQLPPLAVQWRLMVLMTIGMGVYGAWLATFARETIGGMTAAACRRPPAARVPPRQADWI